MGNHTSLPYYNIDSVFEDKRESILLCENKLHLMVCISLDPIGSLIKKKRKIETSTNFYEKLKRKMSNLVKCSITFSVFHGK